ncbi:hypothetical protein GCM10027598_62200 [Amycolatopsis oliviviridis]|uniref:Uncharacterized protein n=1 Tax=Amycolatopsis oliviviridis TaxID=1471590 RepID=A0ABQ3MA69_9PSEU|nr:hypothetical protein GCM10017790_70490 [Amycolatopsis oliviviridis]
MPTRKVVKEAFATVVIAPSAPAVTTVTVAAREGPLHAAQPRKLDLHARPKYMMAPFLAPGARKGAIMYSRRASAGTESDGWVVSGK